MHAMTVARLTAAPTLLTAGPTHASVLAGLHRRALRQSWPDADIARLLAGPGGHGWLALCQGVPVGHLLARRAADEAEILTLGCRPGARRRGVATSLLARALADLGDAGAGRVFLEVAVDNGPAQALYTGAGFHPVGRRRAYYSRPGGPVDALVFAATALAVPVDRPMDEA
jgi:ribosomal-protein-alanine N-acetyltransferase